MSRSKATRGSNHGEKSFNRTDIEDVIPTTRAQRRHLAKQRKKGGPLAKFLSDEK